MSENKDKRHNEFDQYLHHSNPEVRKRAENWGIAIGLQDVDHLTVSPYLIELAKLHIEGKITMNEIETRLDKYQKKQA